MRKLLLATAALVALALPANAVIVDNLGVNPTSAQGAFANDPNGPGVGGTFFDQYLFQILGTQLVTVASATNNFATGGITGPLGIQNFTGAVYQIVGAPDLLPGGDDILRFGPVPSTLFPSGLGQVLNGNGLLSTGNYYLAIAGNAGAQAGYGGDLSVSPNAVPIPGAVWLFGSGLAGLVMLNKRRKSTQNRALAA